MLTIAVIVCAEKQCQTGLMFMERAIIRLLLHDEKSTNQIKIKRVYLL
jgi:hypothetical protein